MISTTARRIAGAFAAAMLIPVLTSAAAPHQPVHCDRACLQKWVDSYLVAMRDQNKDPALFAPDVRFTENGVRLPFGKEGLWWGMSGVGTYKFYIPDIDTQQIAFLGTVRENGKTQTDGDLVAIALRLKIRGERITEVEQIVSRPSNVNSSRSDFPPTGQGVEAMGAPNAIFTTPIPERERMSRAELIETANYYFSGLENNDGKGYYPFTEDCVRFENAVDVLARGGTRTTCKKQFEEGLKGFVDHHRINWTWELAELFRIEKGQIRRIEAIFHRAPFGMASGWSTYEQGISSEVQDV